MMLDFTPLRDLFFSPSSVTANLVCGTLVHMCLTLSSTVYTTLLTTRFVTPPNPGETPVIRSGATRPEAASIRYAHEVATLAFNTFNKVNRALFQKLLSAIKYTFLRVKHKSNHGYSGYSTLDLLTHLYETYTVISNAD